MNTALVITLIVAVIVIALLITFLTKACHDIGGHQDAMTRLRSRNAGLEAVCEDLRRKERTAPAPPSLPWKPFCEHPPKGGLGTLIGQDDNEGLQVVMCLLEEKLAQHFQDTCGGGGDPLLRASGACEALMDLRQIVVDAVEGKHATARQKAEADI